MQIMILYKLGQPTCLLLAAPSLEKLFCNLRALHQRIIGGGHNIITEDNIVILCPHHPSKMHIAFYTYPFFLLLLILQGMGDILE